MKEIAEKLVLWLRDRTSQVGCDGVVFGMSGGIDSSVVAVLCQKAFPQTSLGVIMPCHSDPADENHALLVARAFGIATTTIVLDSVFDVFAAVLPQEGTPELLKMSKANLKPRLRMMALYYQAQRLNHLVVGSSDRSELNLGYFTKWGDGAADILPIGNLLKSQVRELAVHLGVPGEITEKPPTPGLWPGQTAEGEMGLKYEEVDRYLLGGGVAPDVAARVEMLKSFSSHKRALPPIAPL